MIYVQPAMRKTQKNITIHLLVYFNINDRLALTAGVFENCIIPYPFSIEFSRKTAYPI